MTAPLTPHDKPTPGPQPSGPEPSGGSAHPAEPAAGTGDRSRSAELLEAVLVALVVTVSGVLLGLLWLWLAPRVPAVWDGQSRVWLRDSEAEDAIGADGIFILLALGMGVLSAIAVFLFRRRGGVPLVLGLAVGGLLGSLLAWRLGVFLGPETDVEKHAREVGAGVTFDKPLALGAKGALLAWSVAAMAAHLALTGLFGPRDPEPEAAESSPSGGTSRTEPGAD
ncbi:hypothetical protein [Streptomyces sp. XD-27]|uniref:hypothetical protein n=1 Tax=Streptomyces sp. XD-27 TaxID=3062779 RepID=UPI0026F46C5E|nr:hypothetical protein [Streptomyces sp. XD-27]WKX69810.1 hypothetical protein Q3Y56_07705 [Streptomyces sp. XD-27]